MKKQDLMFLPACWVSVGLRKSGDPLCLVVSPEVWVLAPSRLLLVFFSSSYPMCFFFKRFVVLMLSSVIQRLQLSSGQVDFQVLKSPNAKRERTEVCGPFIGVPILMPWLPNNARRIVAMELKVDTDLFYSWIFPPCTFPSLLSEIHGAQKFSLTNNMIFFS